MDASGTSNLPDSQLDRFMISFSLSELEENQKIEMLQSNLDTSNIKAETINWNEIKSKN